MDDLIEALTIFRKYTNSEWPTICTHDVMHIADIEPDQVDADDIARLAELGFEADGGQFFSFRFGSA